MKIFIKENLWAILDKTEWYADDDPCWGGNARRQGNSNQSKYQESCSRRQEGRGLGSKSSGGLWRITSSSFQVQI